MLYIDTQGSPRVIVLSLFIDFILPFIVTHQPSAEENALTCLIRSGSTKRLNGALQSTPIVFILLHPAIAVSVKIPIIVDAIAKIIVFVPVSFIPRIDVPRRTAILAATVRASFDKEGAAAKIILVPFRVSVSKMATSASARRDAPG